MREKERKQNVKDAEQKEKIFHCSLCEEIINKRQISVVCTCCNEWVHLKCTKFESFKEAKINKDVYVCDKCVKEHENRKKADKNNCAEENKDVEGIKNNEKLPKSKGLKMFESDLVTIKEGNWFNDNIISFAFDEMEGKNVSKSRNIVYVKPAVSHLIKESASDDYVDWTINNLGIRRAEWAFIPVNNGTKNEEGSHWSLLLYSGISNTFYHFDPIKGMNDRSAAMIVKKLIHKEKKLPEMKYVTCPRQKNSYDCGLYTIMYMENIVDNIEAGVEITNMKDYDAKEYRKNLRRKIKEKYNLYLNEGNLEEMEKGYDEKEVEKERKSDEKKEEKTTNKNEKVLNDNKKNERKMECWYYTNKTCKFGNRCRYEHKQKCKEMVDNGYCYEQNCRLGHPRICRDIFETGRCKRVVCRHFHPINLRNKNINDKSSRTYNYEDLHVNDRINNQQQYKYQNYKVTRTRPLNEYNWNERKSEDNFLDKRNWRDLMKPIMESAMMALAESMWDRFQQ